MIRQALTPDPERDPARGRRVGGGRRPSKVLAAVENGVRPGRAGMSAPKHNARSGPPSARYRKVESTGGPAGRRGAADPVGGACSHQMTASASRRRYVGSTVRRVYTVAGAELFTSARILAAEQRLVAAAGRTRRAGRRRRHGGAGAAGDQLRTGTALDAGQAALVRPCAAPGRGCSWRSPRPAPGRPPPCAPWLWRGATAAARCSGWPRPPPRPRSSATQPVTGRNAGQAHLVHCSTATCPTGRTASAGPRW